MDGVRRRRSAGASVSPLLANVYAHYVFDLWAHQWIRRHARGQVVIVCFADDAVVGFEYREDAERFHADLRRRLAKFNLELAAEKTRLIEFGRFAARDRQARGLGKPETFRFLGFTHICGKARSGRFQLKRITDSKRIPAKLAALRGKIERRQHLPVDEQALAGQRPARALPVLRGGVSRTLKEDPCRYSRKRCCARDGGFGPPASALWARTALELR